MDKLEKYEAVNKCKTFKELADLIRSFANERGNIQGRQRSFSVEQMALNCERFPANVPNLLTREFGIRQQAMHIQYFNEQ